jgi:hypothetical protein
MDALDDKVKMDALDDKVKMDALDDKVKMDALDAKVDALFGDRSEVTKVEWTKFDLTPLKSEPWFAHSTIRWIFDTIWNNAHDDANGVVPVNAKLTKDDVKKFLHNRNWQE